MAESENFSDKNEFAAAFLKQLYAANANFHVNSENPTSILVFAAIYFLMKHSERN
jgi:hypothetical protein